MDAPNPKRPCNVPSSFKQSDVDSTISSFLSLSISPSFSSPLSIGCSFDRVLDELLITSADQDLFLDRTLQLASLLHESTKRRIRKRATIQNSLYWPLPQELTIKVFSMLDTQSLMQASACCKMFNKCAMDSVCYSHIDLTMAAKPVENGDLCIMIHRAGKELRSLRLGSISSPDGSTTKSLLTRSCLAPLSFDNGFAGGLLRSLHLYYLESMDHKSLCAVLSACSNLTDLKIVSFASGERKNPIKQLALLARNCRLLEQLHLETFSSVDLTTSDSDSVEFVDNHPNLTSLSLLPFGVDDEIAQTFMKGFPQLKHLNLSLQDEITGCFLRGLGLSCRDSPLETLILRNCYCLKEREVLLFLNSLLAGDFKSIRYIDVSSKLGLVSDGFNRTFEPKFPIEELKKQRPGVTFVAIFESRPSSSSSSREEEEEEEEEEDDDEDEDEDEEDDFE